MDNESLVAYKPSCVTEEQVMEVIDTLQSMWSLLAPGEVFGVERSRCRREIVDLIASLEYLKVKVHNREMREEHETD